MIGRSKRLLEPGRAVFADRQQALRKADGLPITQPVDAFANRFGDGCRHALTSEPCQLPSQSMGLLALDMQTHDMNSILPESPLCHPRVRLSRGAAPPVPSVTLTAATSPS